MIKLTANMRFLTFLVLLYCALGAVAGAMGCRKAGKAPTTVDATAEPEPSRRSVQRQAARAGVWRIVYCLEKGEDAAELLALLHEITDQQPFGKRIEVLNCHDLSADTLGTGPISIFGNRIPPGAQRLPLRKTTAGWTLDNAPDPTTNDVLFLPNARNPWAKNVTVAGFFMADDPAALVDRIRKIYANNYERMFWPNWAYERYRANGEVVYGTYADTSWQFDPAREIRMNDPEKPVFDAAGLKIYTYDNGYGVFELQKVVAELSRTKQLIDSLKGQASTFFPEVRMYPSLERIGLRRDDMHPIQYDGSQEVLHLVPGMLREGDMLSSVRVWSSFIDHGADKPVPQEMVGQLVSILQMMVGKEVKDYAFGFDALNGVRLFKSGLLARKEERTSSYLIAAADRYAALREYPCPEGRVMEMVANFRSGKAVVPGTAGDFCGTGRGDFSATAPSTRPMPIQNLAGMTFAHEGYRVHNGYGGEKIVPSMDSLAALNVNALAIVPYTFMRDPEKPVDLFIPGRAGQENDWATIRSAREAHSRGWFVLLKPQIWVGGGHWPGDVDFATDEEWDTFFDNYTYWIMHYALLAEQEQIGGLCLGTELVKTTLKHPDRWRELIRKVRLVYGGQLTYAANWGEEFEGFTFWDDLDAIGLNSYYPLSTSATPTDEELLAGARRWLALAAEVSRQSDRPLWLTEVGFRSVDRSWVNPHAEADGRTANPAAQARCYAALLAATAETPELKGMFVWKWPSYLGDTNSWEPGTRFTPGGKPAARLLGGFYGGWGRSTNVRE